MGHPQQRDPSTMLGRGYWVMGSAVGKGSLQGPGHCCIVPEGLPAPVRSQIAGTEAVQRKGQPPHQNFPYHSIGLSFLII